MISIFNRFTDSADTGADSDSSGGDPDDAVTWVVRWIVLYGDRRVLALVTTIVILVALLAVGTLWEFEMERLVTETRAVQTLFNTLLGGLILFVSVVLSINTAALAQEFAPLQVKLARMEESIEFQIELEELVDEGVSPAGLKPFLEYVIGAIHTQTESLRASENSTGDERARADLLALVDELDTELSLIGNRIGTTDPQVSAVLLSTLEYPYARHINVTRRLKSVHRNELTESDHDSLATLLEVLTILASGREYFTTLYFKRELRNLSSSLLLLSLPVIVFTAYVLLAIDAGLFPQLGFLGLGSRLFYINLAFVIALSPYVLLSSYMLRILTMFGVAGVATTLPQFVHASHPHRVETLPRIDRVHPRFRCGTEVRVVRSADSQPTERSRLATRSRFSNAKLHPHVDVTAGIMRHVSRRRRTWRAQGPRYPDRTNRVDSEVPRLAFTRPRAS